MDPHTYTRDLEAINSSILKSIFSASRRWPRERAMPTTRTNFPKRWSLARRGGSSSGTYLVECVLWNAMNIPAARNGRPKRARWPPESSFVGFEPVCDGSVDRMFLNMALLVPQLSIHNDGYGRGL
jgi:hypothetical protein